MNRESRPKELSQLAICYQKCIVSRRETYEFSVTRYRDYINSSNLYVSYVGSNRTKVARDVVWSFGQEGLYDSFGRGEALCFVNPDAPFKAGAICIRNTYNIISYTAVKSVRNDYLKTNKVYKRWPADERLRTGLLRVIYAS